VDEMALKEIALALVALLGSAALGDGKFRVSASPAFVSMCFPGPGIACCRSSSWRCVSGIWLTVTSLRRPQQPRSLFPRNPKSQRFVCLCFLLAD